MVNLINTGIEKGWYLNEVFIFGFYRDYTEEGNFDEFIESLIESEWETYWKHIFSVAHTDRLAILKEAKKAFESQLYGAAIHIFFSQSDGFFSEKFSKGNQEVQLYKKSGSNAKQEFNKYLTEVIDRESFGRLLEHYKDASLLRRMYNEAYKAGFSRESIDVVKNTKEILSEDDLIIPNRHGVLHGIHKRYATKRHALKCFSLLLFVIFAIHGDDMYSKEL